MSFAVVMGSQFGLHVLQKLTMHVCPVTKIQNCLNNSNMGKHQTNVDAILSAHTYINMMTILINTLLIIFCFQ